MLTVWAPEPEQVSEEVFEQIWALEAKASPNQCQCEAGTSSFSAFQSLWTLPRLPHIANWSHLDSMSIIHFQLLLGFSCHTEPLI